MLKMHGLPFVRISMRLNSGKQNGKWLLFMMGNSEDHSWRNKKENAYSLFLWEAESPGAGD